MKKQSKLLIGITAGVLLAVIIVAAVLMSSGSDSKKYAKHMETAQHYMDELQYERAIAEYEAAIEIEPNNEEAYLALVDAYMAMGDDDSALAVLNRGAERTGSGELADYIEEVRLLQEQQKEPQGQESQDGQESEREEPQSAQEEPQDVQEPQEETDAAGESEALNAEPQDEGGEVTLLVTWDGRYEDGSLRELELTLNGTLDDGTALELNGDGQALAADGTLAAEIETVYTETQGSIRATIYRVDSFYNLEVADGVGYMLHNTNGLSDSGVTITFTDAQGTSTQLDIENAMYRSYTGIWFFGTGIDHGALADYDSSWME